MPGQLEAPQLLNKVTKAQQFPVSQTTFLWIHLHLHALLYFLFAFAIVENLKGTLYYACDESDCVHNTIIPVFFNTCISIVLSVCFYFSLQSIFRKRWKKLFLSEGSVILLQVKVMLE